MGTNAVAEWWNERSKSKVSNVTHDKDILSFEATCCCKEGMIIKVPVDSKGIHLRIDNQKRTFEEKEEFGNTWLYFICPHGNHKVQLLTRKIEGEVNGKNKTGCSRNGTSGARSH
jgi:hypothetical protein